MKIVDIKDEIRTSPYKEILKSNDLIKNYKVYPRIQNFNYLAHRQFLYVYLDPFNCYVDHDKIGVVNLDGRFKKYYFAYEPFYIGKGTGTGYRHNQHIAYFLKNTSVENKETVQKFKEIQKKFNDVMNSKIYGPGNWNEYQANFVLILDVLERDEDPVNLLRKEMSFVNAIGTIKEGTGPLTNQITSYKNTQ